MLKSLPSQQQLITMHNRVNDAISLLQGAKTKNPFYASRNVQLDADILYLNALLDFIELLKPQQSLFVFTNKKIDEFFQYHKDKIEFTNDSYLDALLGDD